MRLFQSIKFIPALLAAWWLTSAGACGQETISRLSSRFLARGEQSLLEIAVSSREQIEPPVLPEVPGVEIQPLTRNGRVKQAPGSRALEFVYEYSVSSYEVGSHTLPAIDVTLGGRKFRTEPLEFTVFNPDDLIWSEAKVGDTGFRYACAFRLTNPRPYAGETTPVEIKLYVPRDLFFDDYGIPDVDKSGITAWRFQPNPTRGQVNLLSLPYQAVAYPSTLTPSHAGKVSIGPAKIRLMARLVELDGIQRWVNREVYVNVPKLDIDVQALPPGAPEGFENAIGDFRLSVDTSTTEVQEGDPIPLDLTIKGSGNLDNLHPPKPVETKGWKIYEASAEQRGEQRRELSGTIVFHQFIRSLEMKDMVPAFRLAYFDPRAKAYKTLLSDPIPLKMTAAPLPKPDPAAPPQALGIPVERMTDILAVLTPSRLVLPEKSGLPGWMWHAVAGLAALALILKALWMRHSHRFHKDPVKTERLRDFRHLEQTSGDFTDFLMSAGRFIERWIGASPPPELAAVLEERDRECFVPTGAARQSVNPDRRREILRLIRNAALAVVLGSVFLAPVSRGGDLATDAQSAYDSANYEEAIQLWLKAGPYHRLSADTLYNIGNACYRAGSPGNAALYYRRALLRNPTHGESRQNLRFIERKYGSITIHRPDYQYVLAKLPLPAWKGLLWTGAWICVLSALVFPATRTGARVRLLAVAGLVAGPLLAASGSLGWRYYPNDSEFAPPASQAVVTAEKAVLHTDASRTSPEVIDAPPGSLCEVVTETGRWAYVAFASKTRGWIPVEMIEKVVPERTPEPPRIRKPRAGGKSA